MDYSLNERYISNSVLSIDTCFYSVFHKTQAEVEEASSKAGLLLRVEEHITRHQNGMGKRLTLSLIYDKCMQQ